MGSKVISKMAKHRANMDSVIQDPQANAFVLPGGKVFVFTGIIPIARTQDGLATVLAHETAHQIARHSSEKMSMAVFLNLAMGLVSIMFNARDTLEGILISRRQTPFKPSLASSLTPPTVENWRQRQTTLGC